jgi:hypothetical protein
MPSFSLMNPLTSPDWELPMFHRLSPLPHQNTQGEHQWFAESMEKSRNRFIKGM